MVSRRVLHTVYRPTATGNPFVLQMVRALPTSVRSEYFSWPTAFFRRFDVVHFQWPEKFVASQRGVIAWGKRARFLLWLRVLRWRRSALVLTVHNLQTHESHGGAADRVLRLLDSHLDGVILLNPSGAELYGGVPSVVIPHGNYSDVVPATSQVAITSRRVLYFGFIRQYKNVPNLIDAFAESGLSESGVDLRIVGKPHSESLRAEILARSEIAVNDALTLKLEALPDVELYAEIAASAVVVLPYTDLYNSGVLIMALTLGRPVVVPRTPASEFFQEKFGSDWIHLFDAPLDGQVLREAVVDALDRSNRAVLDISSIDWSALARDYVLAYEAAIRHRSGVSAN